MVLYLELFENEDKIKQEVIHKLYIPPVSSPVSSPVQPKFKNDYTYSYEITDICKRVLKKNGILMEYKFYELRTDYVKFHAIRWHFYTINHISQTCLCITSCTQCSKIGCCQSRVIQAWRF